MAPWKVLPRSRVTSASRGTSYRRFVQMYGDVVLGMKPHSKEDIDPFEEIMDEMKEAKGVESDTDLTTDDLKELVKRFKVAVKEKTGHEFPVDPWEQLWGSICAVFDSWMNERAVLYRKMNDFPEEWGTAVNVQAMVYGNMAKLPLPEWRSRATPPRAKIYLTVSTWSTRKAKTW